MRVLFILKKRNVSWGNNCYSSSYSSGLFNSASFVCNMLPDINIESALVEVVDNNCIDREVTRFKPDVVIIEAVWVVPTKFAVLTNLHPTVKWIIRNHSDIPFLSMEGISMEWLLEYPLYPNVYISCNRHSSNQDFRFLLKNTYPDQTEQWARDKVIFLPNFYPVTPSERTGKECSEFLDISCFGAIRPLKNTTLQAVAALQFADSLQKRLRFHINASRLENQGEPVLKSLRSLFSHVKQHQLVEHGWMNHREFKELCGTMDFGLQVSYTETFNIVTADLVDQNVPVIVSPEIDWVCAESVVKEITTQNIIHALYRAWDKQQHIAHVNKTNLVNYGNNTKKVWAENLSQLVL